MAVPTFPTELIFHILCHSHPRDVIVWRVVSKVFYAITHETTLWNALYKNALFPLPPSPFPTQSVASLERTLVKAAHLAESWTTTPMRALSSIAIDTDVKIHTLKLFYGRWLVMFESQRRFVLHDVDPAAGKNTQQVLWEEEMSDDALWDVESIVSSEGYLMIYVLLSPLHRPDWKLLEFRLDCNTGQLLHSTVIDTLQLGGNTPLRPILYAGHSRCLFIRAGEEKSVLDVRTHELYKFPSPHKVLVTSRRLDVMLSDTTLISLSPSRYSTAVYIFTILPDGTKTGQRSLCLTHEGVIDAGIGSIRVMKPANNLVTGAMNVKLLSYSDLEPLELLCIEMALPKYSGGVVLPIGIKIHDIRLPQERVRLGRYHTYRKYVDVSDDGEIRGFFRMQKRYQKKRPWETAENQLVMKFAIDTTQDPWTITRSQIVPAVWNNKVDPVERTGKGLVLDGMRGRLCYVDPYVEGRLIIADIE